MEETATEIDGARLLLEFDAVHAWTPRDRGTWRDKKQNVLVDVEELEIYMLSSTGAEGIIGVLAWSVCDREGRTLVANAKQYAMMRAMQDDEHQELHEVVEDMNDRQERLTSTMVRKQQLAGEVPEIR